MNTLGIQELQQLIGLPYGKWQGGVIRDGSPMWASNDKLPILSSINNVSCAGLLNLIFRYLNIRLPYSKEGGIGGTLAYGQYYSKVSIPFSIDDARNYPNGTLIGRYYRDIVDQGHVAIIINGYVLQSFDPDGVNMSYTIEESHAGYYYEYAVLTQYWNVKNAINKASLL